MTIKALYPTVRPTLDLNFARLRRLDPRITYTRASTGTFVGSNGLVQTAASGVPRFDFDPTTGESLGLLVEEARTNSIWPSEPTTASARNGTVSPGNVWAVYDGTVASSTKNGITGLEVTIGSTLDANGFTGGNAIPWGGIGGGGSLTQSATASISFFINPLTWTGNIYLGALPGDGNNTFDNRAFQLFNNGIYTNSVSYVKKIFADGTYWLSGIPFSSLTLYNYPGPFLVVYTTTAGDNAKKYWAGGFQWEAGSFPTSYIPTTSSTVTRAADIASITGANFSSWYSSNSGSLVSIAKTPPGVAWAQAQIIGGFGNGLYAQGAGGYGMIVNGFFANGVWQTSGAARASGVQYSFGGNLNFANYSLQNRNAFMAWSPTESMYGINGALANGSVSSGAGITAASINRLIIGFGDTIDAYYYPPSSVHIQRLSFYPTRLSDAQLQALTQ